MLDITFAKPALPKSGALVLLVCEGEKPSDLWQQADEATGGAIARAFNAAEFKGAKGKTCVILAPGAGLTRVVVRETCTSGCRVSRRSSAESIDSSESRRSRDARSRALR